MFNLKRRLASLETLTPDGITDFVKIIWLTGPDGIPPSADSCLIAGRSQAEVEHYRMVAKENYERTYGKG